MRRCTKFRQLRQKRLTDISYQFARAVQQPGNATSVKRHETRPIKFWPVQIERKMFQEKSNALNEYALNFLLRRDFVMVERAFLLKRRTMYMSRTCREVGQTYPES